MKHLIAAMLFLAPFIAGAQSGNGGQFAENSRGSIRYIGYANGHYSVEIKNKQPGTVNQTVVWLQNTAAFTLQAGEVKIVQLPGNQGGIKIKMKPLSSVDGSTGDMGWLEIEAPFVLPLKMKDIKTVKLNSTTLRIYFTVTEATDNNKVTFEMSTTGKDHKEVAVVSPSNGFEAKQYYVDIKVK